MPRTVTVNKPNREIVNVVIYGYNEVVTGGFIENMGYILQSDPSGEGVGMGFKKHDTMSRFADEQLVVDGVIIMTPGEEKEINDGGEIHMLIHSIYESFGYIPIIHVHNSEVLDYMGRRDKDGLDVDVEETTINCVSKSEVKSVFDWLVEKVWKTRNNPVVDGVEYQDFMATYAKKKRYIDVIKNITVVSMFLSQCMFDDNLCNQLKETGCLRKYNACMEYMIYIGDHVQSLKNEQELFEKTMKIIGHDEESEDAELTEIMCTMINGIHTHYVNTLDEDGLDDNIKRGISALIRIIKSLQ